MPRSNPLCFGIVSLLVLLLCACGPQATPTPTPAPTAAATPTGVGADRRLPAEKGELFSTSGICTTCHTNMVDEAGTDASTDRLWRATMMANAARDPYWRASVRAEVVSHPDFQDVIEDKCATCHMPMARVAAINAGDQGQIFGEGFLDPDHKLHPFALDGVSCNLCHQIREIGFGEFGSFSGHFVIDTELPMGERVAYGPYPVQEDLIEVMRAASGFVPVQGKHIERSELCATCHTLYTPYIDDKGEIAGQFPEQTPYLEWLQSDYRQSQACQDCHMPLAQGGVQLSVTGGPKRSPFYQHVFAGGNAYMMRVFQEFGSELEVTAARDHFEANEASTLDQLRNRTATLALDEVGLSGSELAATVVITSHVGHKFPSGFPSRRVWLHVTVRDAAGGVVFESGAVNADGSITGGEHDQDPARYEPHYEAIDSPDQVQIYESIMRDPNGEVTMILLRGAGYVKDNRLLPAGFAKGTVDEDVAVYGAAAEDPDFTGGGDRLAYRVDVGQAQGPFTVTAELLYQTISYRWAQKLDRFDAPEAEQFLDYYGAVSNQPVIVATATAEVGP